MANNFITEPEAKLLTEAYRNHPRRLTVPTGSGTSVLKALVASKDDVGEILAQTGIKDVIFYFALRPGDLNKPQSDQYFTLILAGIDADNKVMTSKILEHLIPCPLSCPITGL